MVRFHPRSQMEENKKTSNYEVFRPVLVFYAKTTSWIIFPLLLAVLAGEYVSSSTGSQVLFFVFVILGFVVTCLGIYKEIKDYKKNLEKNGDK